MALFNIPKTEREIKYGQLAYTKAPEIFEEYENLRNKIVNDDQKYMKIGGECLEYLYTDEEVDVTLDIYSLQYLLEEYDEIFSKIDNILFYLNIQREIISVDSQKRKKKRIYAIAKIVQDKYKIIIDGKHLCSDSKESYFSKEELINMAEICELLELLAVDIRELDELIYNDCEILENKIKMDHLHSWLSANYDELVYEQFKADQMLDIVWKLEGIFGTKEELRNVADL